MKEILRKKWIWICILAVLVAAVSAAGAAGSPRGSDVITGTVDTVLKPLKTVVTKLVDKFEQWYDYTYRYDLLQAENEALRRRISELEQLQIEADAALEENDFLRMMLDFSTANPDYDFLPVQITARSASSWSETFTISRGSESGIAVGQCVVTQDNYLVGIVTAADGVSATVTTITDTTTAILVRLQESGITGSAGGEFTLMPDGKLAVKYLEGGTDPVKGECVLTSGSDIIPPDIVLGYAGEYVTAAGGVGGWITVSPAADLEDPGQLYVVTGFTVKEQVDR